MATLLDLPTETLTQIICDVKESWNPGPDLKALRHTCQKLRSITDAFFFHSFGTEKYAKIPARKLLLFATAVAHRKELRKNVKCIDLILERNYEFSGSREVWIPEEFDLSALREAIPEYFEGSNEEKWKAGKTIAVYPHVTALISLLPNLEVLRIKVKDPEGNRDIHRLVDLMPNFATLKELKLVAAQTWNDDFPQFTPFAPLLRLPCLKSLALKNFHMANTSEESISDLSTLFDNGTHPASYAPGSLAIEKLSIRNCSMTNGYMIHLLTACRRLTSFEYKEWADIKERQRRDQGIIDDVLDVQGWHNVLSLHQDTLEELSLNTINAFKILGEHDTSPLPAWPSFTSFLALKTLKAEYRRIVYASLPPNIEYLYLFDCRSISGANEIDGWCAIQNYCPHLKQLEIMTTQNCRTIQRYCKSYGFKWGCWTQKTREYCIGDLWLTVWFKAFIDGTYGFSQGTDDTSRDDEDEDEEDEDSEEGSQSGNEEDAGKERHDDEAKAVSDEEMESRPIAL